jgi:hypothetical protein
MALEQGVNSYVTLEDAEDYFETRIDAAAWHSADDEDQESALVTATLILDENHFIGVAVSSEQSLGWPRKGATTFDPKYGMYVTYTETEIPERLKKATYEMAYQLLSNEDLLDQKTQTFEEISVGSITIKDSNSDVTRTPIVPSLVRKFLKPLLVQGGNSKQWWRSN